MGTEPTPGAGAWERTEFHFGEPVNVWNMWTVGTRFVVIAERDTPEKPGWLFVSSETGRDWQLETVPPEIQQIYWTSGTVVDDRLWFVARVRDGNGDTRRLISTVTGGEWQMLPPARGLGARDGADFLARAGGRWFAAPFRSTPGEPFAQIDQDIRVSNDGVDWTVVDAPRFGDLSGYHRAITVGDRLLASGTWVNIDEDRHEVFFATTRTGRSWTARDLEADRNARMGQFACTHELCVAVGSLNDGDDNFDHPYAWTSDDGLDWTPTDPQPPFPDGRTSIPMDELVATGSGWLALGGPSGDAWLSPDGMSWRYVQVLPRHPDAAPHSIGVIGDRIVGVAGTGDGSGRLDIWIGSLAAMGG
jgi:hypothetical protein